MNKIENKLLIIGSGPGIYSSNLCCRANLNPHLVSGLEQDWPTYNNN